MSHLEPRPELYNLPFAVKDFRGMPYKRLGTSGLKVSEIGLGTWKMGYPETGDGSRVDEANSFQIFDRAAELGVTFWDTANRYNNASGNSERIIGKWFKQSPDERRNIVLCTKIGGLMDGRSPNHAGLSRINIVESVYASLERLQTDYIDLLYFHTPDNEVRPEESLAAIEDLVKEDLIRYFGVSNFSVAQLEEYASVNSQFSLRSAAVAVQNQYDILAGERDAYQGVRDYADKNGISFIAWSPMAGGLLSSRYLNPAAAGPGDRLYDEGTLSSKINESTVSKLRNLAAIAAELNIEMSQLVLAYMRSVSGMGPIITSASNLLQLESNAAAAGINFNEEVLARISYVVNPV